MPSSARLTCIDPAKVGLVWPHARRFIKDAMERTRLRDFKAIESEVLEGRHLLWLVTADGFVEAAVTTQLIKVNSRKICVLVACGGKNRVRWLPLLDGIEDYARKEGCAGMRIYGRKGWERALNGYRSRLVILEKGLA